MPLSNPQCRNRRPPMPSRPHRHMPNPHDASDYTYSLTCQPPKPQADIDGAIQQHMVHRKWGRCGNGPVYAWGDLFLFSTKAPASAGPGTPLCFKGCGVWNQKWLGTAVPEGLGPKTLAQQSGEKSGDKSGDKRGEKRGAKRNRGEGKGRGRGRGRRGKGRGEERRGETRKHSRARRGVLGDRHLAENARTLCMSAPR